MTLTTDQIDALVRSRAAVAALEERASHHWLSITYAEWLYGGWIRDDGAVAKPHYKSTRFHEACKDPKYDTFAIFGGNQSSKSVTAMSEFCAWIRGERPWDGSRTAPAGQSRDWLMAGPSFSKHFPLTLNPYFELRMGDWIVEQIKSQQKNTVMYILKNGDRVHCLSYEQYLKIGRDQTNPFEGPRWYGAMFDEPPPEPVWNATQRGLVRARSAGWGKVVLACTPLQQPWIFNRLYESAGNRGGAYHNIFAMEFTIWDNPSLTEDAIERFAQGMSSEEKEARLYGRFRHLTGRVYPEFMEETHTFSESDPSTPFDPLVNADGTPSDWPVIMAMDPHTRRPPFMSWAAVSPKGDLYFVREHPTQPFEKIRSTKGGFPAWKAAVDEVEATLPGGARRVIWRVMDPKFGGQSSPGVDRTVQQEMRRLGLAFRCNFTRTGEASLAARHNLVKTRLQKPHPKEETSEVNRPSMFVSRDHCRNIVHAFLSYIYDDWADQTKGVKEKPQEYMKDPMDAVGFTAMAHPNPEAGWKNRTASVEAQRDMLAARMAGHH